MVLAKNQEQGVILFYYSQSLILAQKQKITKLSSRDPPRIFILITVNT